ncbi:MAG TPA: DUF4157 domain-containing protein [Burkholderiales bacterium]|nr:DUF4157 domain-containing protein [Burkholderiales bacterium]
MQAKLKITASGDRYEQEADRVADRAMQTPESPSHSRAEVERKIPIQAFDPGSSSSSTAVPPIVHEVLGDPGKPLDTATRAFMEDRLGYDLSQVRIHTGGSAAASALAVNARAFTVGRDVFFGAGEYAPSTASGRRLIAHEMAHVAQQKSSGPQSASLQRDGPATAVAQPSVAVMITAAGGASLLSAPAAGAQEVTKLPQGTPITIQAQQGEWLTVQAELNGQSFNGYIRSTDVGGNLQGQTATDPVTNTFQHSFGGGGPIPMTWQPWPGIRISWSRFARIPLPPGCMPKKRATRPSFTEPRCRTPRSLQSSNGRS